MPNACLPPPHVPALNHDTFDPLAGDGLDSILDDDMNLRVTVCTQSCGGGRLTDPKRARARDRNSPGQLLCWQGAEALRVSTPVQDF